MKKRHPMSLVLGMLLIVGGVRAKAWSANDNVCTQHAVTPDYPRLAWFARITGTVNAEVEVAPDGSVSSAIGSGGDNLLNHAAEENTKKWTFCPAKENLKVKIIYLYRFEGQGEYAPSPPRVAFSLPRVEIVTHLPIPSGY
jgi:TonB family protein